MNSEKVTVQPWYTVSDEELMLMSSQNPELRFERNAEFKLVYQRILIRLVNLNKKL